MENTWPGSGLLKTADKFSLTKCARYEIFGKVPEIGGTIKRTVLPAAMGRFIRIFISSIGIFQRHSLIANVSGQYRSR
jgi:hypothetical protein